MCCVEGLCVCDGNSEVAARWYEVGDGFFEGEGGGFPDGYPLDEVVKYSVL